MRMSTSWVPALVTALLFACRAPYTPEELADATARQHSLHALREYETGMTEGGHWNEIAPRAFELRAWYALNLGSNNRPDSAIAIAEDLVRKDDDEPWSWFALAGALFQHPLRYEEAAAASDSALARAPADPDVLAQHASVVLRLSGADSAILFLDALPDSLDRDPRLLVARAEIEYSRSYAAHEPSLKDTALAALAAARAADPAAVEAYYLAGSYLYRDRRIEEAMPLLEAGAGLTTAPSMHSMLWSATLARRDIETERRNEIVAAGIETLLTERGETPATLRSAGQMWAELKDTVAQARMEDRILELYPVTPEAERVVLARNRALEQKLYAAEQERGGKEPALRAEYRAALENFIAREPHFHEGLLGEAYMKLFQLVRDDSTVVGDELLGIVRGMVKYQELNPHIVYPEGAMALAERTDAYEEAAAIAHQGEDASLEFVDRLRKGGVFETDGEYERTRDFYLSLMADALGWVYYNQDRLDDAGTELDRATTLSPDNPTAAFHLGKLWEKRADIVADANGDGGHEAVAAALAKAEENYIRGAMAQRPGTDPNDAALEALYVRRNGSSDGYRRYLASIGEIDRERRRRKVLDERIAEPEPLATFTLASLDGPEVASDALRGRIVVINFWGTWCGPCVAEMPEFQKFHERYRADPGVVVLTIDNDENIDDLRAWMKKREYDFAVLLDDGYGGRVGIHGWPTTWFIDRAGRIAFRKIGSSESLAEEFGWRVEDIRGDSDSSP